MTHDQLSEEATGERVSGDTAAARPLEATPAPVVNRFPSLTDAIDESSVSLFEENLRRGA
jgi:hypothetical protein